jgi:xanthine dehydrogenase YagR molybdenum-binding subunit
MEAALKVTGAACYAADLNAEGVLHAALVTATVPHGRVLHVQTVDACRCPGVSAVLTHQDSLVLGKTTASFLKYLQEPTVYFLGQPVAVVLARSARESQFAAAAIHVDYEALPAVTHMSLALESAYAPATAGNVATDSRRGDPEQAFAAAEVALDEEYRTATHNHHPMEPHCVTVHVSDNQVLVHTSTQAVFATRRAIAESLELQLDQVRVVSRFLGGGFGAKGGAWFSCQALIAAIARRLRQPVRLELTRGQMFYLVGRRQETVQRLRLGATRAGKLTAILHDTVAQTSAFAEYADPVGTVSRMLYACEHVAATHRLVRTHQPQPNPMRAPGESPGSFALETALDELARKLELDPVELRLRNYTDHDQHLGLPFSSNGLRECCRIAANAFGWSDCLSGLKPRWDGVRALGYGMAAACYPVYRNIAEASVQLRRDGSASVRCGTQDVGAGTYTVLAQLVANGLGIPLDRVSVELGDTWLPEGPPSSGARATASFAPAVETAALRVSRRLLALASEDVDSPHHGADAARLSLRCGTIVDAESGRSDSLAKQLARLREDIEDSARTAPEAKPPYSAYSHGAIFAEVSVDLTLGEVRVRRISAAYASGRILNPRFVRGQYIGGLIAGIGMTLHESVTTDKNLGRIVNDNLSDYLLPVHADIPEFDVYLVQQRDPHLGHGVKGVGMIGAVGISSAIANAVYDACGCRVRELPIRLEHILASLHQR